jgi:hypothetical protein
MKELMDRFSYWLEERFAGLEDRTENTMVPPMDETMERLARSCDALKERFSAMSWRRG